MNPSDNDTPQDIADLLSNDLDYLRVQCPAIAETVEKARDLLEGIQINPAATKIQKPFAFCCAEGGGRVEACDCVNKDHGTVWFAASPKVARHTQPPHPEGSSH